MKIMTICQHCAVENLKESMSLERAYSVRCQYKGLGEKEAGLQKRNPRFGSVLLNSKASVALGWLDRFGATG